ncbi:MAG: CheR family methyltransferase, partial [Acidimicrobiia bacterium]
VGAARAADLDRAVAAALAAAGDSLDAAELARRLRTVPPDDPLRRAFVEALTICETHFFRLGRQFDALGERVLPALLLARQATRRLRLWSAGCATGEEAWSLAILLEQVVPPGWDATVLASDVDEGALEHAGRGVYGPRSLRETPEWVRSRWFTATADGWEVGDRLRRRVRFARSNLVSDPLPPADLEPGGVDLVVCRNVLMYFTAEARARTAARLSHCLAPGGWLAVAPAELSQAFFPDLAVRHFPDAILYQRPDSAAEPPAQPAAAPPPTEPPAPSRTADRLLAARAYLDTWFRP